MIEEHCPNCNGELHLSADKSQLICKYCDSVFTADSTIFQNITNRQEVYGDLVRTLKKVVDNASSQNTKKEDTLTPAEKLFDYNPNTILKPQPYKAWSEMCAWINTGSNLDEFMKSIDIYAKEKYSSVSTSNGKSQIFRTAESRILNEMPQNENSLLFVDQGIFSKGTVGFFITNKAIYKLNKKNITKIGYKSLNSLTTEKEPIISSVWHFNNDDNFRFYLNGCENDQDDVCCGVILGLICTLTRDCHSDGYKIKFEVRK